jgi:hypothetical protein
VNFPSEKVFNAIVKAIPSVKGIKIDNSDKLLGRIIVKAGVSLFSWGKIYQFKLSEVSDKRTIIRITLSPKTGIMFGGAFDMGKNRKKY